jgi:hypothetical protein
LPESGIAWNVNWPMSLLWEFEAALDDDVPPP